MRSTKAAALFASIGLTVAAAMAACMGPPGPDGVNAFEAGVPGPVGVPGPDGPVATDASTERGPMVTGPGLKLIVTDAKIDAAGVATASLTITDGAGNPVDRDGVFTDGPVVASFVLSHLALDATGGPGQYAAYTKQPHTSLDGKTTASMADADLGGTFTEVGSGQGTYVYRFGTAIPAGYDATQTHTVGVWAYRFFGGKRYVVNTVFNFVPAGGAVAVTREVVTTQACNQCHNPLGFHEGDTVRRETSLCILCHADGMKDLNNGNSLDMRIFVHKIHRGKSLPSVINGTPYVLHMDNVPDDFSTVWFPNNATGNCAMCHKGAQGDRWSTMPSQALCTTCHDNTDFVSVGVAPPGKRLHSGGVADDASCKLCHKPSGTSLSVTTVHATELTDAAAPKLALSIVSVTNTAPGQTPVLRFNATSGGAPYNVLTTPFTTLAVTLAGPTSDYAQAVQYVIQGAGATGALAADGANFAYTFPAPIPGGATGTYAVGMEASLTVGAGVTAKTYSPVNPVAYIAVTDPAPVPRRAVVERAKCNSCHYELAAHGGTAKNPDYCVMCHSPNKVNDQQVSRFQVPVTVASTLNFKMMVHRIHRGTNLTQQPYVLGGSPAPTPAKPGGTPIDFGQVRYPGTARACWACHAAASYLLPLPAGQLPTKMSQGLACNDGALNPAGYCANRSVAFETFMAPAGAACSACHDAPSTTAHVRTMTAPDGTESCALCHGIGKAYDAQVVHVLPP